MSLRKNKIIKAYLNEMKIIQNDILEFIDSDGTNENFSKIAEYNFFKNLKGNCKCYKLKEVLNLISQISNNHHRTSNFFEKIEKIILLFKNDMKQLLTNYEIFFIFCNNKRIIYFLLKEKIIKIDRIILNHLNLTDQKYFINEIASYFGETISNTKNEDQYRIFNEKRYEAENDNYICKLIRDDSVKQFIIHVNKNNLNLNAKIKSSIFESNCFLREENPTLIEYAAFFGSIQIFNYLKINNAEMNSSLWKYAIHSNNPNLIHILEEMKIKPDYGLCSFILNESIACHHNNMTTYIQDNLIPNGNAFFDNIVRSYNYSFLDNDDFDESIHHFIEYGYIYLVDILLNKLRLDYDLDIHKIKIFYTSTLIAVTENHDVSMLKLLLSIPKIKDGEYIDIDLMFCIIFLKFIVFISKHY